MKAEPSETILYTAHPAMFRNNPVLFVLYVLLIAAFGLGLIFLLVWWLQVLGTRLTVTDKRISLEQGLLSKSTNDIFHNDVRNVRVTQSLFQRIFGVGYIGISSSGQSGIEIEARGIPDPEQVKAIIDRYR